MNVLLVEVHHGQVKNFTRPLDISNMMESMDMYWDVASPQMHLMYGIPTCTLYFWFPSQTKNMHLESLWWFRSTIKKNSNLSFSSHQ